MASPAYVRENPIFTAKYWARPRKMQEKGDASHDDIHLAVGRALSDWEMVEQQLCELFLALTTPPNATGWFAVKRAYGAIHGNAGRRNAVRAAADVSLMNHLQFPPVADAIKHMLNVVAWASDRRDDIAHGFAERQIANSVDHGVFLMPPDYNLRFTTPAPRMEGNAFFDEKYRYTSAEIQTFANKFKEGRALLKAYTARMAAVETTVAGLTVPVIPFVQEIIEAYGIDGKKK